MRSAPPRFEKLPVATLFAVLTLIPVVGCAVPPENQAVPVASLKETLAQVQGSYTRSGDLDRYDYSAKPELEQILSAEPPESAVADLIQCMDDATASSSVLDGRQVFVGVICYQALSQLVYYEPTASDGDIAAQWPGFLTPAASPSQLKNAKAAWEHAREKRLLVFQ